MIILCERCYDQIADHEAAQRMEHVDRTADGTIGWRHSYVHIKPCGGTDRSPTAARVLDRGDWDPTRRGMSPTAERWIGR